jgi:hypothetical protein
MSIPSARRLDFMARPVSAAERAVGGGGKCNDDRAAIRVNLSN